MKAIVSILMMVGFLTTPDALFAQLDEPGYLTVEGRLFKDNEKVEGATVRLEKDGEVVKTQRTDSKGKFQFQLPFDGDHKIFFEKRGCVTMHAEFLTSQVPKEHQHLLPVFRMGQVGMYDLRIPDLFVENFEEPFARIIYIYKEKSFNDDADYQRGFAERVVVPSEEERLRILAERQQAKVVTASIPAIAPWIEPKAISGYLLHQSDRQPAGFHVMRLLDDKGKVLETTITTEAGQFIFTKLPPDEPFLITMTAEDNSTPPDAEFILVNNRKNEVATSSTGANGKPAFSFSNSKTDANKVNLMEVADDQVKQTLTGKMLISGSNEPVSGLQLRLVDEDGNVLVTTTNQKGLFSFANLAYNTKMTLESDDPARPDWAGKKLMITDQEGNVIRELTPAADGFTYSLLPEDQSKLGAFELKDPDMMIAGNLLAGESPSAPLAFVTVHMMDEGGNIIETVVTNAFGSFVFTKLPPETGFRLQADLPDTYTGETIVILTDTDNQEIIRGLSDRNGKMNLVFNKEDGSRIAALQPNFDDLRMDLGGQLLADGPVPKPLANMAVNLSDGEGNYFQTTTDGNGSFSFVGLMASSNYRISIDEKVIGLLEINTLIIADREGNTIRKVEVSPNEGFDYQLLQADQNEMGQLYVEDPWVDLLTPTPNTEGAEGSRPRKDFVIREKVYFASNDWKIQPDTRNLLDKVTRVMKANPALEIELSAHTDSRGGDAYNLELSRKRARSARDYIVDQGIPADRLSYEGFGESRLVNHCRNGVDCTDTEHAQNRRVEFRVIR